MAGDRVSSLTSRRGLRQLARVVLAVTVSMTVGEFADLQKLGVDDLRARFRLARSCEPTVTAVSTDASLRLVTVAIDCRSTSSRPSRSREKAGS